LLINLQQDLIDVANMKSDLVAAQTYVLENKVIFNQDQKTLYDSIVSRLQSRASVAAM
jgi:hypothetical protein